MRKPADCQEMQQQKHVVKCSQETLAKNLRALTVSKLFIAATENMLNDAQIHRARWQVAQLFGTGL